MKICLIPDIMNIANSIIFTRPMFYELYYSSVYTVQDRFMTIGYYVYNL